LIVLLARLEDFFCIPHGTPRKGQASRQKSSGPRSAQFFSLFGGECPGESGAPSIGAGVRECLTLPESAILSPCSMMSFRKLLALGFTISSTAVLQAQVLDGIEAVVHDAPVTLVEVQALTLPAVEMLQRQYAGQEQTFQTKVREAQRDNLEHLVQRQLILQEFTTYKVPETILDKDVDKRVEEKIRDQFYGDRVRFIKTLQAEGMTYEKFRQQIRDQFVEIALRQKNVSSEIIVSPHKIETYYAAHKEDYKVEEEIKLRMIVLTNAPGVDEPKKLAEEILGKINEGASFTEMAGIYSQGSQKKENGDWGWVERKVLRKELAEASASLKPGEHSGVIATDSQDTFYIMLVEDRRPAHYKPLGDLRDEIEKNLVLEERNRLEQQWIARLKKKTFVKYTF
jgi:peptidyl-prolyl cis-trans isomerase SurA